MAYFMRHEQEIHLWGKKRRLPWRHHLCGLVEALVLTLLCVTMGALVGLGSLYIGR
jgi:hypothetical protein